MRNRALTARSSLPVNGIYGPGGLRVRGRGEQDQDQDQEREGERECEGGHVEEEPGNCSEVRSVLSIYSMIIRASDFGHLINTGWEHGIIVESENS
jgi:hypothetical protein